MDLLTDAFDGNDYATAVDRNETSVVGDGATDITRHT